MRTVTLNLYNVDELSAQARLRAIRSYQDSHLALEVQSVHEDRRRSLDAFCATYSIDPDNTFKERNLRDELEDNLKLQLLVLADVDREAMRKVLRKAVTAQVRDFLMPVLRAHTTVFDLPDHIKQQVNELVEDITKKAQG